MTGLGVRFSGKSLGRLAGVVGFVAAGIGLVSDVLGFRGGDAGSTVVITVPVTDQRLQSLTTDTSSLVGSTDPEVALDELRASLAARSSSGPIEECGIHAVLATLSGVRVFEWNGSSWTDFSGALEKTTTAAPIGIQVLKKTETVGQNVMVTFDRDSINPATAGILTLGSNGCETGFVWRYFAKSDGSFSRNIENLRVAENGSLISTTRDGQSIEFVWDDTNELYSINAPAQSEVVVTPGEQVQSDIASSFVANYSRFTTDSFSAMLNSTEPGSPAQQLVRFLLIGKQISRDAGYGEGSGFEFIREGSGYRIMAPGGGTLLTGFKGSNGLIRTFDVNSVPLDRLVRIDEGGIPTQRRCSNSGICVGIRGIQLGNRTVYFALEIDGSQTSREVKFREAFLESTAGSQRHIGATTPQVKRRPNALWSVAFPLSDLPWGGKMTVHLLVGGAQEQIDIVIAP